MTSYKLFGRIKSAVSANGHLVVQFDDDQDTYDSKVKLDKMHKLMTARIIPSDITPGGLIKPVFNNKDDDKDDTKKEKDTVRKPYTNREFVVKVPKGKIPGLPIDGFVCLTVIPVVYKFEKNKRQYTGWSIKLRKLSIETYIFK